MEESRKVKGPQDSEVTSSLTLMKGDKQTFKIESLDMSGIHWGYLNCWQSYVRGKKIKTERWFTYWVDLCGGTMRIYRDKALPPDSAKMTPSPSIKGPSKENEQKVAFFGLQSATVEVLQDGALYAKKLKQADFAKIFRRHLFRMVFTKINSTFIFQAPSNSSMLRWVSKIQEAITMSEFEQVGAGSVDDRLKFAKFTLEQRRWNADEPSKAPLTGPDIDDEEDFKKPATDPMTVDNDPRLKLLKEHLQEKIYLLNQLVKQEENFLGGETEQEVTGKELCATTLYDYYLVPGRRDTFVSKGTKMTLFGQMPDKRWRCWVEIDDLITSMNKLIAEADETKSDSPENAATKPSLFETNKRYLSTLKKDDVLNRGYPLIGSVPNSLMEELQNLGSLNNEEAKMEEKLEGDFVGITPPISPTFEEGTDLFASKFEKPATPYSSHSRRTPRKALSQLSFDTFFFNEKANPNFDEAKGEKRSESFNNFGASLTDGNSEQCDTKSDSSPMSTNVTVSPSWVTNSAIFGRRSRALTTDESPVSSANNSPVMPVKLREGGFIIKKRLRQKGISIIVGSSSSEGESGSDEEGNTIMRAESGQKSASSTALKRFSTSDISPLDRVDEQLGDEKESINRLYATLPKKGSQSRDLLEQYGRSGSVGETSHGSKLFPKPSGPDVKPPRNERRTLKLSKSSVKGYGFYLQTFVFASKTGEKDAKTFVRYVEEEGPAYMAGLREGDVIVEIGGEDACKKDHAELVNAVKNSQIELKMVVKFTDAVKRAELAIKLKKKKDKLRARMKELEELNSKEKELLHATSKDSSAIERADSVTSSGIGLSDDSSENLSSLSEHVIIQTSKFEEQSPVVKDSISEVRYCEDARTNNDNARTHITTTSDLLSAFSSDGHAPPKQFKSKPVNRSRSFSGSEKKVDPDSVKFRGRLNSKDDGFITAAPSQTKSRPAAKVLANRAPLGDNNNREGSLKKPYKYIPFTQEQMFYNPPKSKSGVHVQSRFAERPVEESIGANGSQIVRLQKSESLSPAARERILSRNSRSKSYKIAVTTSQDGGRTIQERVVTYDQLQHGKAPETDL